LDTVVSETALRGNGLGAILMAEFVCRMKKRFGERLTHLSTIAVHPNVAHTVGALGFHSENLGATPLWQAMLTSSDCPDVVRNAKVSKQKRLAALKQKCVKCARFKWEQPWCTPEETKS